MTNTNTDIMINGLHIDRGINCAQELEMILSNLKENPKEFDQEIAKKLIRTAQILKHCLHDCYETSQYQHFSYDESTTLESDNTNIPA